MSSVCIVTTWTSLALLEINPPYCVVLDNEIVCTVVPTADLH